MLQVKKRLILILVLVFQINIFFLMYVEQGFLYADGGASIISVLTEPEKFKGSLDDMLDIYLAIEHLKEERPAILRKDFIFDSFQLLEARAYGADSILLIVAILSPFELKRLIQVCLNIFIYLGKNNLLDYVLIS